MDLWTPFQMSRFGLLMFRLSALKAATLKVMSTLCGLTRSGRICWLPLCVYSEMTNWWRILCFVFCILYFVCLFRNDKLMSYFVLHHLPSVSQVFRFLHPAPRLWTQRQTDTQTGRRQIKVYAEANFFIEMVNTPVLRVIFVFWVCWCFDRSSLRVTFLHFRSAHWCNSHTGLHMSNIQSSLFLHIFRFAPE